MCIWLYVRHVVSRRLFRSDCGGLGVVAVVAFHPDTAALRDHQLAFPFFRLRTGTHASGDWWAFDQVGDSVSSMPGHDRFEVRRKVIAGDGSHRSAG